MSSNCLHKSDQSTQPWPVVEKDSQDEKPNNRFEDFGHENILYPDVKHAGVVPVVSPRNLENFNKHR